MTDHHRQPCVCFVLQKPVKQEKDMIEYDIRVKRSIPTHVYMYVGIRPWDPPHMEREVEIYLHESAECGRSVGARSA